MTKVLYGKELDQAAIDAAIARSPFNAHEKSHVAVSRSVMALMYKDGYRASEAAHADYRALEDDYAELRIAYDAEYKRAMKLEEELAALRGQYEMVRQCCMDETVRATRLMGDLEAMRALVEGSLCAVCDDTNDYDTTSRVCRRCQDVDATRTPKEQTK